jgi:hypothetical protein
MNLSFKIFFVALIGAVPFSISGARKYKWDPKAPFAFVAAERIRRGAAGRISCGDGGPPILENMKLS